MTVITTVKVDPGVRRVSFTQFFRKGDIPPGRRVRTEPYSVVEVVKRWADGSVSVADINCCLGDAAEVKIFSAP